MYKTLRKGIRGVLCMRGWKESNYVYLHFINPVVLLNSVVFVLYQSVQFDNILPFLC